MIYDDKGEGGGQDQNDLSDFGGRGCVCSFILDINMKL